MESVLQHILYRRQCCQYAVLAGLSIVCVYDAGGGQVLRRKPLLQLLHVRHQCVPAAVLRQVLRHDLVVLLSTRDATRQLDLAVANVSRICTHQCVSHLSRQCHVYAPFPAAVTLCCRFRCHRFEHELIVINAAMHWHATNCCCMSQ